MSEENVELLKEMGFEQDNSFAALIECKNDVNAAVDWLTLHGNELATIVPEILSRQQLKDEPPRFLDGPGQYDLIAVISHMGSSTACGHYVCHIKKNDQWIIFNDEKVAVSESPPFDLGYMYLYKRKDVPGLVSE